MRALIFAFAVAGLAFVACSPYSPDLGAEPFFCGSGTPRCPDGYACMGSGSGVGSALCVSTGGGKPVDGGNLNAMCADDSQVEGASRNDTISTAYALPDLSTRPSCQFVLTNLAICPMGDKDNYSLVLSVDGKTIQADIQYDSWGSALQGAIANSGGTPIKTLQAGAGSNDVSGAATNLPAGQYFIEVFGPAAAPGINNYKMTVTMTPCP
jgi:hypothetical protein